MTGHWRLAGGTRAGFDQFAFDTNLICLEVFLSTNAVMASFGVGGFAVGDGVLYGTFTTPEHRVDGPSSFQLTSWRMSLGLLLL